MSLLQYTTIILMFINFIGSTYQTDPFIGIWENDEKRLQIQLYHHDGTF